MVLSVDRRAGEGLPFGDEHSHGDAPTTVLQHDQALPAPVSIYLRVNAVNPEGIWQDTALSPQRPGKNGTVTGGVVSFAGRLRENTEQHAKNRRGGGIGEDAGTSLQVQLRRAAGDRLRRDVDRKWANRRISRIPETQKLIEPIKYNRSEDGRRGRGTSRSELTAADAGAHLSAEIGGRGCRGALQREKLNGRKVLSLNRARQPQHQPGGNT
ncbi:hypothetical protein B0H13DRAFT_1903341 [Mycena leptocephala]|nr:hypothetical protein B0H13DRAFT_1903341 [Mycena leptocephala]